MVQAHPLLIVSAQEVPAAMLLVGRGEHVREPREALVLALAQVGLEAGLERRAHAEAHRERGHDVGEQHREEELGGDAESHPDILTSPRARRNGARVRAGIIQKVSIIVTPGAGSMVS